jgi:DNA-binding NarL/FixJ family response regulator
VSSRHVTVDGDRVAAQLLADAGIAVGSGGDIVCLLARRPAAERLARIRAFVAGSPDTALIAAMPGDAGGSTLRRALQAGIHGIVFDDQLHETLVPTVKAVLAGQLAVPLALRRGLAPQALSHREKQIMSLVVAGLTNRQIAAELFLSESTVKTHLSSAFGKLDVRSRAEAAALILDPDAGYRPVLDLIAPRTEAA